MNTVHRWLLVSLSGLLLIAALVALLPVGDQSREEIFEIPKGTWAGRMAGNQLEILPQTVYLTVGRNDVLVLRNLDDVPQMFGPTLIMPNQSFKLPFELAGEYQFACTAHTSGQMTVTVDPAPTLGWQRLQWRAKTLWRQLNAIY